MLTTPSVSTMRKKKKEPEITITCGNCPESDECPGFDGCFYLAANCPKKKVRDDKRA